MMISDLSLPEYIVNPPAVIAKSNFDHGYKNRRFGKVVLSDESGYKKVFTSCLDVPGHMHLDALTDVLDYLGYHENPKTRIWAPSIDFEKDVKVTVLQHPKHGVINHETRMFGWTQRDEQRLPTYQGWDKLIYQVQVKGQKFKVVIDLLSIPDFDPVGGQLCERHPKAKSGWKVGNTDSNLDDWFSEIGEIGVRFQFSEIGVRFQFNSQATGSGQSIELLPFALLRAPSGQN